MEKEAEKLINSDLVRKICAGDARAYRQLFESYCSSLVFFTRRLVGDLETAENIVQDIFLWIWQNRAQLDPAQNIKTYLFTSAKNKALNHIRHENIKHQNEDELKLLVQRGSTPEEEIYYSELSRTYHQTIERLPEKCNRIFSMSRFEQLSYKEIARELNISVKTVETQMSRALKFIRKNLVRFMIIILTQITN